MPESVGVFTTDRDLVVQVWDSAIARFTGIEHSVACGRPLASLVPDLQNRGLMRYFRRVLEDGVVEVLAPAFHRYLISCPPQVPSTRFDKMQQRVTIAPLEDDGHVAGVLVTIEDVTQRLDHEHAVAERLKQESSEDTEGWLRSLQDRNWRVRENAVSQIARSAAPDGIAALLRSVKGNHRNFGLLNSALKVLRLTNVDVQSTLIEFLRDGDEDLRIQAALALGDQNEPGSIPALIAALNDTTPNVVYHAIEALGKLRATDAAEMLMTIAESGDFFLAFPALEALAQVGNTQIALRLYPLLDDPMLCEPASQTLARIGDETAVEPLVRILNNDQAPAEVVAEALASLYDRFEEQHGEGQYIGELCARSIRPEGIQRIIDAISGTSAENLRPLVLIVGWVKSPAASRAAARHLGSPQVQDAVVEALVRHGHPIVELLMEQLRSEDVEVRGSAVVALGRIRDKRATSALTRLLRRDEELTVPILSALQSIGDPSAVDSLFELMATPDAAVRRAVVSALSSLATPEVLYRVIPLMDAEDPGVREAAVRISGYFGYPEWADCLFLRCSDEDENVRRAAIEHLPYLDDPRTPDVLANALRREVPAVRAAAAVAMAHVDPGQSVPHLLEALDDNDPWVRYFTARSLDRHRAAQAASSLYRVAQCDRFQQVRIAALEALSKIDPQRAASVARTFMSSSDSDLRHAAEIILMGRNGK
jgi:HEAT repeat protein